MAVLSANIKYLIGIAALGAGLMAGLLFAFSNFVMNALTRMPPPYGMSAMQLINVTIINPLFFLVFMGTAVASIVLLIHGALHWSDPGMKWVVAGSVLYLLGVIGVTLMFNVPLNNALAQAQPAVDDSTGTWMRYVEQWLRWNDLRTLLAILSLSSFLVGLYLHGTRAR
jgi:uncharacterized membrane protein